MKASTKHAIIIAIGVLIVILLVLMDAIKKEETKDYSNLTEEELAIAVQKEVDDMEINTLSSKNERERIEYYVSKFIGAVEDEDYEKAYGMLYDDFKKNYFPTLNSFEEYAKSKFSKVLSLDHSNFERNGEYYVLWITLSDPLSGKNAGVDMNFVVQENGLNDFVMSFSVI